MRELPVRCPSLFRFSCFRGCIFKQVLGGPIALFLRTFFYSLSLWTRELCGKYNKLWEELRFFRLLFWNLRGSSRRALLWHDLGPPQQQLWMKRQREKLNLNTDHQHFNSAWWSLNWGNTPWNRFWDLYMVFGKKLIFGCFYGLLMWTVSSWLSLTAL